MDCKISLAVLLCVIVLCESRVLHSSAQSQTRFRQWGRRSHFPAINKGLHTPSQGQGHGQGHQGQSQGLSNPQSNSLTHSLALNNLQLAPGQTRVIKQTIVLRGRKQGQPQKSGQNGAPNPRSGRKRFRTRLTARRLPQNSNRGHAPQPINNGLYLLRTSGLGSPQLIERNGVASLSLPILHASHPGNNGASGIGGQGPGPGASQASTGKSSVAISISAAPHGASGRGTGHSKFAHVLLSGNQNILIIPHHQMSAPVTMTSSSVHGSVTHTTNGVLPTGSNKNGVNSNINGVHLPGSSVTYTHVAPTGSDAQAKIVQTTIEPGEDPPEAP